MFKEWLKGFKIIVLIVRFRNKLISIFLPYYPYNIDKQKLSNVVPCSEPIVAIGSMMRSGGNLLNRLLDGHIELRTYHSELLFGVYSDFINPKQPTLLSKFPIFDDLHKPRRIFQKLIRKEKALTKAAFKGFIKVKPPVSFIYKRRLHKKIFLEQCSKGVSNSRQIFDNYLTGFFNSYIDCQSLHGHKKFITTYWPGFTLCEENVDRFFLAYPQGKIIHIFRSPYSWAGSAKKRDPERFNWQYMDQLWLASTEIGIAWKQKHDQNFLCIDFDDLVVDTSKIMKTLSEKLDIEYSNSLIYPTFNRQAIAANSIHIENQKKGIVSEVLTGYKKVISNEEIEIIRKRYSKIFAEAKKLCL